MKLRLLLFFLLAPFLLAERPPNVLVIMADDLGYGDVSCYGAKFQTPHIDRLAAEGIRFTSGYCSASTCTPTRYSFLTGTYAFRREGTGIAPPNSPALIPAGTVTLPSLLQQADYRTAVIGKWHLGLGSREAGPQWNGDLKPGPLEIGFHHCFLLPTTNDRVPQVYVRDHRVLNLDPADPLWVGNKKPAPDHPTGVTHRDSLKMNWSHGHNQTIHNGIGRIGFYTGGHKARWRDEDLADKWVEQSVKWIEANRENPFFLFFSSHDLHVPRMPHERFHGKTAQGFRSDAIVQLDWCVGELLATLERLDLDEQTLIVFCSDNGPVLDDGYQDGAIEKLGDHEPRGPFRGGKYNVFEAETRTPFITRWPGVIRPAVSDELVCTIDLAASLAAHLDVDIPEDACLDSLDVMDALLGKPGAKGRDHLVQQDNGRGGNYGLRVGKWKLQRVPKGQARNVDLRLVGTAVPGSALYDLDADPRETRSVREDHPEMASKLNARLDKILADGRTRPK